ncbi:uncharacterized protein SPSK_05724 [Sporothrix schenckii 1099-18]|uniref:Uncharacterized protein n=1 Tax=Sporothrix schenckii 1099-18 TaxID=1397361 RepID=A0A0F2LSL7_SPOSC|nr:uncharacterized protein SPSK_05724 [Sporothrix schenckii 1099-18]KJR80478.1 hypothetical protein SPSK_05724 [Sporothrix schenckii 1099-18]
MHSNDILFLEPGNFVLPSASAPAYSTSFAVLSQPTGSTPSYFVAPSASGALHSGRNAPSSPPSFQHRQPTSSPTGNSDRPFADVEERQAGPRSVWPREVP